MSTLARRLDRLEASTPAQGKDMRYLAWLRTLSDEDIDLLGEVAEYVKAGGTIETLEGDTRAAITRLETDQTRFYSDHA